ncbi:MAG: CoA transferase subunit A [Dehalococcoidia bacterium]
MINKVVPSFDQAVSDVADGASVHVGGFIGPADWPAYLISALGRNGAKHLTVACCNMSGIGPIAREQLGDEDALRGFTGMAGTGVDHVTVALLIERGQVRKGITTFSAPMRGSTGSAFETMLEQGRIELELVGQGTLAERIRAAKAGIPAFYSPVSVGTPLAAGRETRWFDGVECLLEKAINADFALIRAAAADRYGNLVWEHPSSFNATMAGAATITIAEVDRLVDVGALGPSEIEVPGVLVDRVVVRPSVPMKSWREAH